MEDERREILPSLPVSASVFHPHRRSAMRFMILVKANPESEAGAMPGEDLLAAMGAYHEELANAGVLLDGVGLKASSQTTSHAKRRSLAAVVKSLR